MTDGDREERAASFRYGAVLALTLVFVVFVVVAPADDWTRGVALALQGGALGVAVGTSRDRRRRTAGEIVAIALACVAVAAAVGVLVPAVAETACSAVLAVAVPVALSGGLLRLVRAQGVTLQVVAGALAIYLLVGVTFAAAIGVVARIDSDAYFAQGTDGSPSQRLYYSLTVLTTTGFGDLTAAQPTGRALAVLEMLTGQLYLVTVIGVLVGDLAGRRVRR